MSADLWQAVAGGEAAAVYAYGVLAPRLDGLERNRAVAAHAAHSRARDAAVAQLAADGTEAVVPGAFELPFDIADADDARRLAAVVEDRLVNIYASLAPQVSGRQRRRFVESARECSARAVAWGARPEAFPGTGDPDMAPVSNRPASAPPKSGDGATLAP